MRFLLPFMAHFLGDFILKSSTMASKKRFDIKAFVIHTLIYSSLIILSLIWFGSIIDVIFVASLIIISHTAIDFIKNVMMNKLSYKYEDHKTPDFIIFIADQVLHILVIACSIHLLRETNSLGQTVMSIILLHMSSQQLFNLTIIAFLYILCLSPAGVFIKEVFVLLSFQNEEEQKSRDNLVKSGYIIGVLERIIILTLGLNGQLGAIGFVLTAKSLARFNQLSDKNFAEKYLIGTLLSVTIALLCIVIGNSMLIK